MDGTYIQTTIQDDLGGFRRTREELWEDEQNKEKADTIRGIQLGNTGLKER